MQAIAARSEQGRRTLRKSRLDGNAVQAQVTAAAYQEGCRWRVTDGHVFEQDIFTAIDAEAGHGSGGMQKCQPHSRTHIRCG